MDRHPSPRSEREPAWRRSASPQRVAFDEKKIQEDKVQATKDREEKQQKQKAGEEKHQGAHPDPPKGEESRAVKTKAAWLPWWRYKKDKKEKGRKGGMGNFSDPARREKDMPSTARVVEMREWWRWSLKVCVIGYQKIAPVRWRQLNWANIFCCRYGFRTGLFRSCWKPHWKPSGKDRSGRGTCSPFHYGLTSEKKWERSWTKVPQRRRLETGDREGTLRTRLRRL